MPPRGVRGALALGAAPSRRMRSTPSSAASPPSSRARRHRRVDECVRPASRSGRSAAAVEDRGVEPVARGAEARVGDAPRAAWVRGAVLGVLDRQRVHQRGERGGVVEPRLYVHLAQLDRAELRVRAYVPPEARVVVEPAGVDHGRPSSRRTRRSRAARGARRGPGRRGSAAARALARPESRPNQNGEFADSAGSSGRSSRRPLRARIAVSGSGMPTCTCSAHSGVRRSRPRIASPARR